MRFRNWTLDELIEYLKDMKSAPADRLDYQSPITLGDDLEGAIKAIEALQAELDRLKNCRRECKIVCLLDEYNKKCTELEKAKAELMELRIAWDMYGGAENITGAFAELEKVKAELDTLCKMQPVKLEKAEARSLSFVLAAELSEVRGELEKVKAENARLRREREADT
jgi:hypothetical protein